jgi:thiol-disulfide isomerase/thioredoxin
MRVSLTIPAVVVAAALLPGCDQNNSNNAGPSTAVAPKATGGAPTPSVAPATPSAVESKEVTLQVLDYAGLEKLIARHRGQVVVVDFWSTACPPCVKEFPELVALQNKFDRHSVACISVSLDYDGSEKLDEIKPSVLQFLQKQQATFDNVLCSEETLVVCKKAEIAAPPAVLVYDPSGDLDEIVTQPPASSGKSIYERVNYKVKLMTTLY